MRAVKFNLGEFKAGNRAVPFCVYTFPGLPNYHTSDKRSAHPGTPSQPPLYYRVQDIVAVFLAKFPEYIAHCIPVLQGFDPFYIVQCGNDDLFIIVSALRSIAYKFPDQPHLSTFCNFHLEEFHRGQASNLLLSLGFTRIARPVTCTEEDLPVAMADQQPNRLPLSNPPSAYPRGSPPSNAIHMNHGPAAPPINRSPRRNGHSYEASHSREAVASQPAYSAAYPADTPGANTVARGYDPRVLHDAGPPSKRQRSIPRAEAGYASLPSLMDPSIPPLVSPASLSTHPRDTKRRNSLNLTVCTPNYDDQPVPVARPAEVPNVKLQPTPRPLTQSGPSSYPPPSSAHAGFTLPTPRLGGPVPPYLIQRGPASSPLRTTPPTAPLPRSRLNSDTAVIGVGTFELGMPPSRLSAEHSLAETLEAVRYRMERLAGLEQRMEEQLRRSTCLLTTLQRQAAQVDTAAGSPTFWTRMHTLVRTTLAGGDGSTTGDSLALLAEKACPDLPGADAPTSPSTATPSPFPSTTQLPTASDVTVPVAVNDVPSSPHSLESTTVQAAAAEPHGLPPLNKLTAPVQAGPAVTTTPVLQRS
ncbi:hypothetical protein IWQ60_002499 [Tieghemiomyces parasiticus]|uniref:Uncharacterized protein n=1 Tax=Tieghemiomyces parasiticus TaxID=78921 RepID=A0A9W8DVM6_9FUNG|nr:hypothetical protein IWQ60_002499 [Tieghemiomyces parasiticus]